MTKEEVMQEIQIEDKHTYQLIRNIARVESEGSGSVLEVNLISWDDQPPVYDVRRWNSDHTKASVGVKVTVNELEAIIEAISDIDDNGVQKCQEEPTPTA